MARTSPSDVQLEHRRAVWRMVQPVRWATPSTKGEAASSPFDGSDVRDEAAMGSAHRWPDDGA